MDLTVQIITHNSADHLKKTLKSLPLCTIIVNDLESQDDTLKIAKDYNCKLHNFDYNKDYSKIRNKLTELSETEWQLYLNPGEIIIDGKLLNHLQGNGYYLPILSNGVLTKEVRIWNKKYKYSFVNPIFETLMSDIKNEINIPIYSNSILNVPNQLQRIQEWKKINPLLSNPYYYESLYWFSLNKINEFEQAANHYMFLDTNKKSIASTIHRYYYALVQLHKKDANKVLQYINPCILTNPLMAEFWCLTGDVYYHLLNKFNKAKKFYENAIILGSKRRNNDKWPMEIDKYKKYPNKMIESCNKIIGQYKSINI